MTFFRPQGEGDFVACTPQAHDLGFRPAGRNGVPAHHGREFACAAGGQEGRNLRFPPSCGSPLSLRRATGAVYRSPAKQLPPTCCCDRRGLAATPEGWRFPFLLLLKSGRQFFSVTHLCARQRALICGSKCRKSSGRRLTACSRLEGKGVIRKRGENLVSPLFASRSERACEQPPAGRLLASRSAPAPRRRTHPAARRRRTLRAAAAHKIKPSLESKG